ncbi:MAG: hypothetical protein LUM44_13525 [Pyrinomonadaceae bacterium]|nr:hypothetical protein [Pyrinomonadaceae bacterium]
MIEYKLISGSEYKIDNFCREDYQLYIENELVPETIVRGSRSKSGKNTYELHSTNSEIVKRIFDYRWEDFSGLRELSLTLSSESDLETRLLIEKEWKDEIWYLNLYYEPKLLSWKNIYSYEEFESELLNKSAANKREEIEIKSWKELDHVTIEFKMEIIFRNETIGNTLNDFFHYCNKIYSQTVASLESKVDNTSISSYFNFQEKLKVPCQQYLIYFVSFLKDLGINATSDLREEAGKVLFSVTPTDENQALDKIREALAIYLKLPGSPIIFDDSFKSMRLQQQIENLQHSQRMAVRELQFSEKLIAAQSDMLHEKNLTISQLQFINEQQQKIIEKISSKSIIMDSVENKEELEKIYDGLEAGYSKWLYELTGIKANVIKVVKTAVKNTFGKEEKNSVLGLEKE